MMSLTLKTESAEKPFYISIGPTIVVDIYKKTVQVQDLENPEDELYWAKRATGFMGWKGSDK